MLKETLRYADLSQWTRWALILFLITFTAVVIWAWTRSRKEVEQWSNLPLEGDSSEDSRHE